ncbi:MAG: nuclear transport factor 2 family protein [Saprospiraceae bacterium]|nr:nuclear transport factor 2 family protein [Saprospiraceae bacterium]
MNKIILALSAALLVFPVLGQTPDIKVNNPYKEKTYIPDGDEETPVPGEVEVNTETVESVIKSLFTAMWNNDSDAIKRLFVDDAKLLATEKQKLTVISIDDFAANIASAPKGSLDERITSMEVKVDDHMASAWVGYDFYYQGNFSHCGVDAFQLHKGTEGWKIISVADTRRKECALSEEQEIGSLLDDWHAAAANGNLKQYFNAIDQEGYFLGTDASENWNKDAFYQFSKPYFDKGQAWKFTPSDRKVFLSEDGKVAWFNELLDTWMGTCRGSGILSKDEKGSWKIQQYNLAILVPNELVQDYNKLRESKGK